MKYFQNNEKKTYRHKLLAASITALLTATVASSVTQASDIDIYQEAKSGQVTLMLLFDLSGSMNRYYQDNKGYGCDLPSGVTDKGRDKAIETAISGVAGYNRQWCNGSDGKKYYDRITRLKDAVIALLYGDSENKITKLPDDKVIGLATFQGTDGYIRIPARPLGDKVTATQTQRDILIDEVRGLIADKGTPTFNAVTEVASYMMGTNTQERAKRNNSVYFFKYTNSGTKYRTCTDWNTNGTCNTFSSETSTNPILVNSNFSNVPCSYKIGSKTYDGTCYNSDWYIKTATSNSGYPKSYDETKILEEFRYRSPDSLTQSEDIKKCSGQGIYTLTDGEPSTRQAPENLMQNALNNTGFKCSSTWNAGSDDWNCAYTFNDNLILNNNKTNPLGLKIKTAIVGFGSAFSISGVTYDKSKTPAENIAALGKIDTDQKRAAKWGILGEGGWYSGSSSQSVVDSINSFLGDLGSEIPSVTTGSPTIPKDALNPAVLQDDAYYQQFQPTPDKGYSLWVGNLKKYMVGASGKLQGRSNRDVTDSRGRFITPTYDASGKLTSAVYDFWSPSVESNTAIADADENTIGSKKFAAKGGTWSQLKLRTESSVVQRKLFTNRIATGTGTSATFGGSDNALRQVDITDITDITYQNDQNRGYLMSLLGYNVDAANPGGITETSLASTAELRQTGAVMHSLPVLVTNKGKVTYDAVTKKIGSTNREDYVLFGTTQGLLHVVDAVTGQEKFAFVPNEMVDKQKQGFSNYTATTGGMNNLYYGIDGPWTVHTEYVIDNTANLTVGTGRGIDQKGKQLAFGGLRMGGRSYYSLDLKNIDTPKLNFHINPDAASSDTPLSYMGESWSKPTVAYVNWGGVRKLVMFVGGGYDRTGGADGKGYETNNYNQTNKKGAGVYMFSAEGTDAGSLLWWASANATTSSATANSGTIGRKDDNLQYSVVSEIRTVDRDGDDLVDHLYFGDLSGQLFRIDLDNKAPALGAFSKAPIRLLNLHKADGKSPRFYDMPSFSIYNEKGSIFSVVSIGSGNRSQPLLNYTTGTTGVEYDAIYNLYDKDVARKDLFTATSWNTKDVTSLGLLTEENRYTNTTPIAPYATNGWYYKFDNCVTGSDGTKTDCDKYKLQSEKVFGTPLAMNYRLYVSTFDSSKPGISGDCGAGVKGESFLTAFCLPFGQCKSKAVADGGSRGTPIGIGIQNITTGNDNPVACTGSGCNDSNIGVKDDDKKKVASSSNYCANTGGRIIVTTTGSGGKGEATQMCLIPQRWYEKNIIIK